MFSSNIESGELNQWLTRVRLCFQQLMVSTAYWYLNDKPEPAIIRLTHNFFSPYNCDRDLRPDTPMDSRADGFRCQARTVTVKRWGQIMSKLFQMYEDDLQELEKSLPEIAEAITPHLTPRLKTQIRRVQRILSNVRWNYGPPTHVETEGDDAPGQEDQSS